MYKFYHILILLSIVLMPKITYAETQKYLIEKKTITSPTASVSFSNIPYSDTYELTGKYIFDGAQPAVNNFYGLQVLFNDVASSTYQYSANYFNGTSYVGYKGTSNNCTLKGNGFSDKYVYVNTTIQQMPKRYGNRNAGSSAVIEGTTTRGFYADTYASVFNVGCTYTDSLPITKINLRESGWSYNFVASTTFELWGTKEITASSGSGTTVNIDTDYTGFYVFGGIWTFLMTFFGLIYYFRTRIKSL